MNRRNSVTRCHCKGSLSNDVVFIEDCIVIVLWCALWTSRVFCWDGGIMSLGTYDEMIKHTTSSDTVAVQNTIFNIIHSWRENSSCRKWNKRIIGWLRWELDWLWLQCLSHCS